MIVRVLILLCGGMQNPPMVLTPILYQLFFAIELFTVLYAAKLGFTLQHISQFAAER